MEASEEQLRQSAPVFAALGDETRLYILARLTKAGPQSITQLAQGAPITRQAITKHLHVLLAAGLVSVERHGREQRWWPASQQLQDAQRQLAVISQHWDEALSRIQASIEHPEESA